MGISILIDSNYHYCVPKDHHVEPILPFRCYGNLYSPLFHWLYFPSLGTQSQQTACSSPGLVTLPYCNPLILMAPPPLAVS